MSTIPITKHGAELLKDELHRLKHVERPSVINAISEARAQGDLSENAEYHQAREEQGKLEGRIQKIEEVLRSSEVVSGGGGDEIEIGSKVTVQKQGTKEEKTYQIVGSEEADMAQGKISNRSPFGEALFGKKKGEIVSFETPKGKVDYKIINVS